MVGTKGTKPRLQTSSVGRGLHYTWLDDWWQQEIQSGLFSEYSLFKWTGRRYFSLSGPAGSTFGLHVSVGWGRRRGVGFNGAKRYQQVAGAGCQEKPHYHGNGHFKRYWRPCPKVCFIFLSKQLSLVLRGAETAVDSPCLMSGLTGNVFTQGASEEPLDWENMPPLAQRHPRAINHKFNCLNIWRGGIKNVKCEIGWRSVWQSLSFPQFSLAIQCSFIVISPLRRCHCSYRSSFVGEKIAAMSQFWQYVDVANGYCWECFSKWNGFGVACHFRSLYLSSVVLYFHKSLICIVQKTFCITCKNSNRSSKDYKSFWRVTQWNNYWFGHGSWFALVTDISVRDTVRMKLILLPNL